MNIKFLNTWILSFLTNFWGKPSKRKNPAKLYDDALVWSAVFIDWLDWFELIYELIGLTLSIWFFDGMDLVHLIDWLTEWLNPIYHIRRCMPNILYLMVANFMRYCTRIKMSHGCRFHEILHQNQNIPCLLISWDITPESKYLMVADFTRIKISCGCKFHEILHQDQNINGCRFCDILHQDLYVCLFVCLLVC